MSLKQRQQITSLAGIFAVVGIVLSPVVAGAASQTANTTINASLGSTISVSTSSTVAISITPTSGGVVSSNSDTVSVSTNNTNGYTLSLADSDATTTLVSGGNSIAAHSGTYAAPSALGANSWGYAVAGGNFDASYSAETNNGSSTSKWAGVPATGSSQQIRSTNAPVANEATTVWYGVKADTSKPNGTYSDTVTYTAVTS